MSGRIVSVDEAIRLLTEYKKNGGENVLFSSFDLDTRSPDCEAIPISVTCGIKLLQLDFQSRIIETLYVHIKNTR